MITHVLLATNGLYESLGAVRFAQSLQERLRVKVDALGVVEPLSLLASGEGEALAGLDPVQAAAVSEALEKRVRSQLRESSGTAGLWPLTFRRGSVAPTIAEVAAELRVDLVIVGLTREKGLGGFFSREMIVRLTHLLHAPVLAIPAGLGRHRTAVAAIDGTPSSVHAARILASLLPSDGMLHLACVLGNGSMAEEATAHARLKEVKSTFDAERRIAVRSHLLSGNPSDEILKLVRDVGADVVASGSHGAGLVSRAVVGGVAERLLHSTPCSILIAPPAIGEDIGLDIADEEILPDLGAAGD